VFDIGPGEFLVLLVIAVILFGPERLPELARKAARTIRYIRTMADNAQRQLKDELGPDFSDLDVRDLNPKTFVRKHLLDEVEPIVADVKNDVKEASAVNGATAPATAGSQKALSTGGPQDLSPPEESPVGAAAPFDSDAT
jgi:sec-independent protein translocase protein TatB